MANVAVHTSVVTHFKWLLLLLYNGLWDFLYRNGERPHLLHEGSTRGKEKALFFFAIIKGNYLCSQITPLQCNDNIKE